MSSLLCSNDDFSTAVSSRQLQSCQFQRQRRLLHENPRLRVSEEECFYFVEQRPSSASSSFYLPTTTTTQQYENEYGNANVPEICVHPTVRWRVAEAEAAAIIDDGEFEAESTTIPTPAPVFYYADELTRPTIMTITKTRTRTVISNIDEEYPPPSSSLYDSNNNNNNNNQQQQEQEQQEDEKKYEHKWMYYSREIIFELLGNNDGHHNPKHTEQEVAKMMSRAVYTTNVGRHMVFENEYCRLWDFSILPGGGNRSNDMHHHVLPYAFVFLQHGKLRIYKPATTARDCNNNNNDDDDEHEIVEEYKEQTGDNDTCTRARMNNTEYVGVMERQSGEVIWSPIANGGFELEEQKVEEDVENGDGNGNGCENNKINNNIKSKKGCWKPSIPKAVHSVENDLSDSTFREYMIEIK